MTNAQSNPHASDETLAGGGTEVMRRISHHALLSGLCQFIPVPFVDDAISVRVRRRMVTQLLRERGRGFDVDEVKTLFEGPSKGVLGTAGSVAKSLVLKPLKKLLRTVFFVATIRRALLEAAEVLLLGHTLDRLLADGWFAEASEKSTRRGQASDVQRAVAELMASPERRGLVKLIRRSSRLLRREDNPRPPATAVASDDAVESALDKEDQRRLESASAELADKLADEEGRSTLTRIDASIDRRLGR